jgi:ribosomal-protein-alanine N-acetyltransferase
MSSLVTFTPIRTSQLQLRMLEPQDADAIWEFASDPQVTRYTAFATHRQRSDTEAYLRFVFDRYAAGDLAALAMVELKSDQVIGTLGVAPARTEDAFEIGWAVQRRSWNRGYATQALRATLEHFFCEKGAKLIFAHAAAANAASIRVMQKAGMHRSNAAVEPRLMRGQLESVVRYEATAAHWSASMTPEGPSSGPA